MADRACSRGSRERATRATSQPAAARLSAIRRPMPRLAPVTSARRPVRSNRERTSRVGEITGTPCAGTGSASVADGGVDDVTQANTNAATARVKTGAIDARQITLPQTTLGPGNQPCLPRLGTTLRGLRRAWSCSPPARPPGRRAAPWRSRTTPRHRRGRGRSPEELRDGVAEAAGVPVGPGVHGRGDDEEPAGMRGGERSRVAVRGDLIVLRVDDGEPAAGHAPLG